jgi:hypothetical protein
MRELAHAPRFALPDQPDASTPAMRPYFASDPTTQTGVEIRHGRAAPISYSACAKYAVHPGADFGAGIA